MARVAILLVRLYRRVASPLLPANTCKYHPSCSQYALDALREFGFLRGSVLAAWRLLRCNPWSHGGVDWAFWPPSRKPRQVLPRLSGTESP